MSWAWWLMPVILAIQEAEIRKIVFWSQLRKIVHETLSWKNPLQKGWWNGSRNKDNCLASMRLWVQAPVLPKEEKAEEDNMNIWLLSGQCFSPLKITLLRNISNGSDMNFAFKYRWEAKILNIYILHWKLKNFPYIKTNQ
jgi:hypothetical protein